MRRPKPFQEWKRWAGTLALLAAVLFISACDIDLPGAEPTATPPAPTPTSGPQLVPAPTTLPSGLPQLLIRAVPLNLPRYDRDDWRHWVDDDGDCQNARHETLVAESRIAVTFTDEERCTVATGEWLDPYTGNTLTSARDLDVDHMVPLANAHRSGAWDWDATRRRAYANDLTYANHLIAVTNSVNRAKSDSGPDEWRPPDASYWCQYAIDWVAIKADWGLSVDPGGMGRPPRNGRHLRRRRPLPHPRRHPPPPSPPPQPPTPPATKPNASRRPPPTRQPAATANGFPAETVPSARDGDGDGVVCERTGAAMPTRAAATTHCS